MSSAIAAVRPALTEAEWEYAARAGTTTAYAFGDDPVTLGDHAWFSDNSDSKAQPVGEKKANAFGLYDMHGNVQEWVQDCYGDYAKAPNDGSAAPEEASSCMRTLRGGSWVNVQGDVRAASRSWVSPGFKFNYSVIGFRVVRVLSPARTNYLLPLHYFTTSIDFSIEAGVDLVFSAKRQSEIFLDVTFASKLKERWILRCSAAALRCPGCADRALRRGHPPTD